MRTLTVLIFLFMAKTLMAQCEMPEQILINEVLYRAKNDNLTKFIELKGKPFTKLDCMKIVLLNGGKDGTKCDVQGTIKLDGYLLDENGFFVVAADETIPGMDMYVSSLKSNLQTGPDGVALVFEENGEELVYDALIYNGEMPNCSDDYKFGSPAPDTAVDKSLGRCSDVSTGDNSVDFQETKVPTPKSENICKEPLPPCEDAGNVVINEILYDTSQNKDKGSFIELKGDPGLNLACYEIQLINGSNCEVYNKIPLEGYINSSGIYLIGMDSSVEDADIIAEDDEFQNGPDAVKLIYHHDSIGDIALDVLGYGSGIESCDGAYETAPAPKAKADESIARVNYGASDTNDNSKDFVVCDNPTPGMENSCGGGGTTTVECADDNPQRVKINEILYWANKKDLDGPSEYIELKGEPGLNLSCYKLVSVSGDDCSEKKTIELTNYTIDDTGYFVIAKNDKVQNADMYTTAADLSNGPDALKLVYVHSEKGEILVDSVVYGGDMSFCKIFNHDYAKKVLKPGFSLARIPDGDGDFNDSKAFSECKFPAPKEPNKCTKKGCTTPDTSIIINEFLHNPLLPSNPAYINAFIEIKGTPGTDLSCYAIETTDGSDCGHDRWILLSGVIPESGYYVIGADASVPNYNLVDKDADLESGPDAVALIYNHEELGEVIIDQVAYKGDMSMCIEGKTDYAPATQKGESLATFPEEDFALPDNERFIACKTPTPGEKNSCPGACIDTNYEKNIYINEIFYSSRNSEFGEFIELKGPKGFEFNGCYRLIGVKKKDCEEYNEIVLEGKFNENGYFVVASDDTVPNAQMTSSKANYQDSNTGIKLVYMFKNKEEKIIDSVIYNSDELFCGLGGDNSPAPPTGYDASLERCPDEEGAKYTGNSDEDFDVTIHITPGEKNYCGGDITEETSEPSTSSSGGGCTIASHQVSIISFSGLFLMLGFFFFWFRFKKRRS